MLKVIDRNSDIDIDRDSDIDSIEWKDCSKESNRENDIEWYWDIDSDGDRERNNGIVNEWKIDIFIVIELKKVILIGREKVKMIVIVIVIVWW